MIMQRRRSYGFKRRTNNSSGTMEKDLLWNLLMIFVLMIMMIGTNFMMIEASIPDFGTRIPPEAIKVFVSPKGSLHLSSLSSAALSEQDLADKILAEIAKRPAGEKVPVVVLYASDPVTRALLAAGRDKEEVDLNMALYSLRNSTSNAQRR